MGGVQRGLPGGGHALQSLGLSLEAHQRIRPTAQYAPSPVEGVAGLAQQWQQLIAQGGAERLSRLAPPLVPVRTTDLSHDPAQLSAERIDLPDHPTGQLDVTRRRIPAQVRKATPRHSVLAHRPAGGGHLSVTLAERRIDQAQLAHHAVRSFTDLGDAVAPSVESCTAPTSGGAPNAEASSERSALQAPDNRSDTFDSRTTRPSRTSPRT